ncbi:MAG: hypothetical protein HPY53_00400 [Brevinematales bacterium]|nr:hypothetical protein [Brevinematales bacterium]
MKTRIKLICLMLLVSLPVLLFSQDPFAEPGFEENMLSVPAITNKVNTALALYSYKKDPFAGAAFSLIYAGAGQFYLGDYTKGSLLFLGETLYHLFNYGIRLRFQTIYGDSASFNTLSATDQVLVVSSFFIYIGIKAFSMYDAYTTADLLNRQIDKKLQSLSVSINSENISVSYGIGF